MIRLVHDPMFYPGVGPFTGRITKHEERPGKGRPLPNAPGTCRTHRQSTSGPAHRNGGHRPGAEQYCYHRTATTTGVVMALSRQGLIDLPSAIALVLGGNLGTCITAVLASIGGTATGKRVALAHVLLNLGGVMAFLPLLHPFSVLVQLTDPPCPARSPTLKPFSMWPAAWPSSPSSMALPGC